MTTKKACCCMPIYNATILFLVIFMLSSAKSFFSLLKDQDDPIFKEFFENHRYIYYEHIFMDFIGFLVFLAAIASLMKDNKFCIVALKIVIVFTLLEVIFIIIVSTLLITDGAFEKIGDNSVAIQTSDTLAENKDQMHSMVVVLAFATYAVLIGLIIYTTTVFYRYIKVLQEKVDCGESYYTCA